MGISNKNIAVLILAAGASSRMGTAKQLLPWDDTTLLGNAIQQALSSMAGEVVVLLGANAQLIKEKVSAKDVVMVENTSWEAGMGSTIACGMQFLLKKKKRHKAVLIMLSDQPLMDTAQLDLMMQTFQEGQKGIIATGYGKKSGVPAIFDQSYFEQLSSLTSGTGAKDIIDQHKSDTFTLDAGKKTLDVDTSEDYQKLRAKA